MAYQFEDATIETDAEGFLSNMADWSEALALVIAEADGIDMTANHWEVIHFLRDYYQEYQIAPAVRILIKSIREKLGPEKGNSMYLYELFPDGPAVQGCKIAGLPKPTRCI